ncbi:GNAT family N-acetyltransferase [Pseudomonas sp. RIT-PI-S]|uniref:GNAT family N-acetyltransferase n=1 Tax=Pseudomonas sp. RIT-PI-S TaxID=3035295 RepID=UPI0021D8F0C6|nr:GNAT family N-acetyltransferase [Pseudomonas sp. RIT-PI-S]
MTFCLVRAARLGDCCALRAIHANSANGVSVPADNDPDLCGLMATTRGRYPFLVAECNDQVVGFAYARAHKAPLALRWSVDITVYMNVEGRRAGMLRSLYRSLLEHLQEQGYLAVYAAIAVTDSATIATHEALGFAHIGMGQALDLRQDAEYWCLTLGGNANLMTAPALRNQYL